MQKFLRLNAVTKVNRYLAIELVKDRIASSGGWILDFRMFSNLSATIGFELSPTNIMALWDSLNELGLKFSEASLQAINELVAEESNSTELQSTLQITFVHDEPDVRIPVPMIPG